MPPFWVKHFLIWSSRTKNWKFKNVLNFNLNYVIFISLITNIIFSLIQKKNYIFIFLRNDIDMHRCLNKNTKKVDGTSDSWYVSFKMHLAFFLTTAILTQSKLANVRGQRLVRGRASANWFRFSLWVYKMWNCAKLRLD